MQPELVTEGKLLSLNDLAAGDYTFKGMPDKIEKQLFDTESIRQ